MAGAGNGSASKDGHLQERGPGEDRRLEEDRARQHYRVYFTPKPISYLLHRLVSAAPRPWSKSSRVSPHLGCSLKQPPSRRYPSRFLHQWLQEPQKPWQDVQMCFLGLADEPVGSA